jgi:two-component system, chemotaxis family, chemotaxis protein CheY
MGQDIKFLLVDDFSTMRRIVKTFLHDLGYPNVQEAENGNVALPMLKAGDFDFLITDWNVPGAPGLELVRAVRADPKLATMPVLLLTAQPKPQQIVVAMQAGVSGYVIKPFTSRTLREKLQQILHDTPGSTRRNHSSRWLPGLESNQRPTD